MFLEFITSFYTNYCLQDVIAIKKAPNQGVCATNPQDSVAVNLDGPEKTVRRKSLRVS